ncbi:MAG: DUF721 domain-containing protein, partial [Armatimonadetes bacterium]|nr:DUF721 domain-containing protein [Armatimonadota bacterium]
MTFVPLKALLKATAQRLGWENRAAALRALEVWPQVVGTEVARHARAMGVRDGVLTVATAHPAWSQELSLRRRVLMADLASRLGPGVITDIRFVQERGGGGSEAQAAGGGLPLSLEDEAGIEAAVADIKDEDLREAARRAFRA